MIYFCHSSKLLLGCLLVVFSFSACQSPTSDTTNNPPPEKVIADTPNPNQETPLSPVVLPASSINEISQTQPLTTYIQKKMGEQLWHFSSVRIIKQPEKSKAFEGKWIQFNEDNTILSGFYEEAGNAGKWVYDEAKDLLTIIENEEGERPNVSQWNVKFSSNTDDLQIWVGTSRFQNNNTQMKMVRRAEKPKKG